MAEYNGFLLVDKPAGISSFGVVARVRRVLSQEAKKRLKVGHTGTLDPFATGLMIIVVGDYCKRASEFSKLDKVYETTIHLGQTSTTGDPEGELTAVSTHQPSQADIEAILPHFRGDIMQTPPAYSAIKINGQRAYQLARRGQAVAVPARQVTVFQLELLRYQYPNLGLQAHVSSGTYIRTLAADIGQQLGTGAYCQQLRRTKVGAHSIDDSVGLDDRLIVTAPLRHL